MIYKRPRALVDGSDPDGQGSKGIAVRQMAIERMRDVKKKDDEAAPPRKPGRRPEWASGLRQLYDSVVEEPLPDSFADLISKLDKPD
ncbi:MAG TPA: NepR family anti-sigma factor [Croceicoccus sp.]|nr:NepR family anti-sigma factor [Croceicoccus sp.]